jgi:hypothetical protein
LILSVDLYCLKLDYWLLNGPTIVCGISKGKKRVLTSISVTRSGETTEILQVPESDKFPSIVCCLDLEEGPVCVLKVKRGTLLELIMLSRY